MRVKIFVEYCILQLLNYKRPFSSVHYIVMSKCNNPKLIIEVLEKMRRIKNYRIQWNDDKLKQLLLLYSII